MNFILLGTIIAELLVFSTARKAKSLLPKTDICGTQDVVYYLVVGGFDTTLKEFPWMAALEYQHTIKKERKEIFCGGSLINKRYVLTAAHCLLQGEWNLTNVRLGEYNTKTSPDCAVEDDEKICAPRELNVQIEKKIPHESYNIQNVGKHADIALLRLDENVTFSEFVRPICLPKAKKFKNLTYDREHLTIAGWGYTTPHGNRSVIKQKLQVQVVDNPTCRSKGYPLLDETQICAGVEKGEDSCKGDSGGPLLTQHFNKTGGTNWYAVGIIAFAQKYCGMEDIPAVHTRVSHYVEWIESKIEP